MNTLLHFLANFIIIEVLFQNASRYIVPIWISSTLMDLDHLPYVFRQKRRIFKKGYDVTSRSFIHEISGLVAASIICLMFYIYTKEKMLSILIFVCFFLHLLFDFIIGDSRPFYPFSKSVYSTPFRLRGKKRIMFEIIGTAAAAAVFFYILAR